MNLNVEVGGEEIRSDINSENVKDVYPKLPVDENNWSLHKEYVELRKKHLKDIDDKAYESIKENFPDFKPPGS